MLTCFNDFNKDIFKVNKTLTKTVEVPVYIDREVEVEVEKIVYRDANESASSQEIPITFYISHSLLLVIVIVVLSTGYYLMA